MFHLIRVSGQYLSDFSNQGYTWTDNPIHAAICDRMDEAIRLQEVLRMERHVDARVVPLHPELIGAILSAKLIRLLPDEFLGLAIDGINRGAFTWRIQLPRDRSDRLCWQLMTGSIWCFPYHTSSRFLPGPPLQYLYPANQWLGQHQFTLPEAEKRLVEERSAAAWEMLRYYQDSRKILLEEFQKVGL